MPTGGGTTTQTQNSEPWKASQPYLQDIMKESQSLFKSGQGFAPFGSSTVAPQSFATSLGQNMGIGTAMQGSPLPSMATNKTAGLLQNNGLSQGQGIASGFFNNMAQGGNNLDTSQYDRFTQPGDAYGMMKQTAQGDFLNGSPYLDKFLADQEAQTTNRVNQSMSSAGRYGSGAHTKVLADALASQNNNARLQNYGQERQNQLSAIQGLGSMDQQQLGALNSQFGAQQQNLSNQSSGAQNLSNIGQQGIGNMGSAISQLPTINDARYADINKMLGIGSMQDQYSQTQLDDLVNQFNQQQQRPFNQLQAYNSAINPLAALGGSSTGTTTQPGGSPLGFLPLLLGML